MKTTTLITGFLGSGKTTFLKLYASYCLQQGKRIGIIENDFGAVNVDRMLLADLEQDNCFVEMVSGGCDADCHKRRFKTKLIALGMQPFDEIIIEPSGLFDTEEFFDCLREEPLESWYEIGNVLAIVDATVTKENLSSTAKQMLVTQIASAGAIIISKTTSQADAREAISFCNALLREYHLPLFGEDHFLAKPFEELLPCDFQSLQNAGYHIPAISKCDFNDAFDSMYILEHTWELSALQEFAHTLLKSNEYGRIFRIKGFFQKETGAWFEYNATTTGIHYNPISEGQKVIIVIGEGLKKDLIQSLI